MMMMTMTVKMGTVTSAVSVTASDRGTPLAGVRLPIIITISKRISVIISITISISVIVIIIIVIVVFMSIIIKTEIVFTLHPLTKVGEHISISSITITSAMVIIISITSNIRIIVIIFVITIKWVVLANLGVPEMALRVPKSKF